MKLYELCGENRQVCFGPYVWRTKYFLAHKGLSYETVPLRFVEKSQIDGEGAQRFPTLEDGGKLVGDSFEIAQYLDEAYPENKVFGSEAELAQAHSLQASINSIVLFGIFTCVAVDVWKQLDEASQAYFRETREKAVGQSLEDFVSGRETRVEDFRKQLDFLRAPLASFPYLSGNQPGWLDYTLMGTFMWAHTVSDFQLLEESDPLYQWRERMLDLWDGKFRNVPRAVAQ